MVTKLEQFRVSIGLLILAAVASFTFFAIYRRQGLDPLLSGAMAWLTVGSILAAVWFLKKLRFNTF